MGIIDWDEALEIGVVEVDRQHRRLVDLINEAFEASSHEADQVRADCILADMSRYAVVHFAAEEKLMEAAGFEGLAEHKEVHLKFVEQVARFAMQKPTEERPVDIFLFLSNWLKEHIMKMDREFGPAVRAMLD